MNTVVQGTDILDKTKGRYLIAASTELSPRILPSMNPAVRDLILEPFEEIVIDPAWLDSILLMEQYQNGTIALRRDDKIPVRKKFMVAEEYQRALRPNDIQFIYLITHLPLTDQVKDNIRLTSQLGPRGIQIDGSKVTRTYLKGRHLTIIRGALELEQRHQNRAAVKKELTAEIKKIEALD